jgi:formaldehyde-activating enzyme involved in methanogenesis
MKKIKFLIIAAQLLTATVVMAGTEEAQLDRPSFAASQTMVVTAVVEAINHETRVVTIRKSDGEEITFTASEEARNLGQVSVGDTLVAELTESVTIDVIADDGMGADAASASALARTKEGEMPGVAAMDSTIVISTVEEINVDANTFKLKGPDGVVTEYVARNPENLKRSKVGDLVVVTETTAMAITVEKAPAE